MKAVSPLIATILLIVVAVILVGIFLTWGKSFTTSSVGKSQKILTASELEGSVIVEQAVGNNILLLNNSKNDSAVITGYKIITDDLDYPFLGSKISLDQNVSLGVNSSASFDIACFPSSEFKLTLYTTNERYINVIVHPDSYNAYSCLDYNLLAHWRFSDTDIGELTIQDATDNNRDAIVNGTTVDEFWLNGNHRGIFDGSSDYLDAGSDFLSTSALTVCSWIYQDSWGEGDIGYILSNGKVIFKNDSGSSRLAFTSNASSYTYSANSSIDLSTWYFVCATRDVNGIANLYVDGSLSGTADQSSGTPSAGTTNIIIGNNSSQTSTFDGMLGDIRIYNRVLSSTEISDLYTATKMPYT